MSTDQDTFSDEDSTSDIGKDNRKSPGEKRKNLDDDPDDMGVGMFNEEDEEVRDQGEGEKIK
jgi:hypothetical protein